MTIVAIHTAEPAAIRPLNKADLGERLLDEVVGFTRVSLPNAAAIVLAFEGLRAVADAHGLDAACLWIGSDADPKAA